MKINSFEEAVGYIFKGEYNDTVFWKIVDEQRHYIFCDIRGNPIPYGQYAAGGICGPWNVDLTVLNTFKCYKVEGGQSSYNPVHYKIKQMEQRFKERNNASIT